MLYTHTHLLLQKVCVLTITIGNKLPAPKFLEYSLLQNT